MDATPLGTEKPLRGCNLGQGAGVLQLTLSYRLLLFFAAFTAISNEGFGGQITRGQYQPGSELPSLPSNIPDGTRKQNKFSVLI